MKIDLSTIPFSRYGSYFVISILDGQFWLRDIRGGDESPSQLFMLQFEEDVDYVCTETQLTIFEKDNLEARIDFIFPHYQSVHIKTQNLSVELIADKVRYDSFNFMDSGKYEYISYKKENKYGMTLISGKVEIEAPWMTVGNENVNIKLMPNSELYIENYRVIQSSQHKVEDFDVAKQSLEQEYSTWLNKMPVLDNKYEASKNLASYLLWTNTVGKDGLMKYDITYMSKNWMQNIWSWDNCFNAILMADQFPELAYNQLKVFIDYQDESGAYADFINDKFVSYNCVKPPIHAWAYRKMMAINPYFQDKVRLNEMYDSLVLNTNFWLNYRTHNDLPYYTHGNDSGWDNASIFHEGFPVTAPDLSAYLIQQMDILSSMAEQLGKLDDATCWKQKADNLFERFLPTFYDGTQFRAFHTFSEKMIHSNSSAILFLPIVISYRFEEDLSKQIIQEFLSRFECNYGIATEEASSSLFTGDGYWLGPIWAPETYIFVDALFRAGFDKDALRISEKFCEATLIGGLAENFNPHTGEGNDDLAFSWTSSVLLLLGNTLKMEG